MHRLFDGSHQFDKHHRSERKSYRKNSDMSITSNKPGIIWKEEPYLIERMYFVKKDNPKKQMTEKEVYENREKVLESLKNYTHHSTSKSETKDKISIKFEQEKLKWEAPRLLDKSLMIRLAETEDKIAHQNRIKDKIPCYYNREYQIPSQPKRCVINKPNSDVVLQINFELEDLNETKLKEQQKGAKKLKDLFVPGTTSLFKSIKKTSQIKGILKKESKTQSFDGELREERQIELLKSLILILGLNVHDLNDFVLKTNHCLKNISNVEKLSLPLNLKIGEELIEKFHKFRLQNYSGKSVPLLPKKSLRINLPEPTPNPMNNLLNMRAMPQPPSNNNFLNFNITKKNNPKRKRVPCVWYHSTNGCQRGSNCDFIHDVSFKGMKTPNMDKYVRPISKLSRNPDMNRKNIQRYQHHPMMSPKMPAVPYPHHPQNSFNNYPPMNNNSIMNNSNKNLLNQLGKRMRSVDPNNSQNKKFKST